MFDTYKMLRGSGLDPVGAALTSVYIIVVAGPVIEFSDWYAKKYVGETGFEFDDDFDGNVEFIEDPRTEKFSDLESLNPPVGSPEWDEWIDKRV